MAATATQVASYVPGSYHEVILDVTGDSSYPTGGYAVSVPPISKITFADVSAPPSTGHIPAWDYAAGKLKFFTAAGSEVAATTNLSAVTVRVMFVGTGAS